MRWSETFIPTMKEAPREAEAVSHQLMLRAGLIQNLSSGLYLYLPLGHRVIEKIKGVIRSALDARGAIELTMPSLQPRWVWEKSGRWETMADLMMRVTDRDDKEFVLGPTHEEIITDLVSKRVHSYRDLPLNFYQIQTKFRDEIRPRFGVIRAKEFIMKDGYSFDLTHADTMKSYERMVEAYFTLFRRLDLPVSAVEADTGAMGDGGRSQEFVVPSPVGEDTVVVCSSCGYAANLEMAERRSAETAAEPSGEVGAPEVVETPGARSMEEVSKFLKMPTRDLVKALIYVADAIPLMVCLRGDLDLNPVKLKRHLRCRDLRPADESTIRSVTGAAVGFAGPLRLPAPLRVILDTSVPGMGASVTGANEDHRHLKNVLPRRDFPDAETADVGNAVPGDLCARCGTLLDLSKGIEVGHVFYLGKKYTEKLEAKVLDPEGREVFLEMGCYGIGVSRLVAAIIETHQDATGICWPVSAAPFEVLVTALDFQDEGVHSAALELYAGLKEAGLDVLLDDRDQRPGFKFKDAELIGIPLRLTLGKKSLERGEVEWMLRAGGERGTFALKDACQGAADKIQALWEALPA